MIKVKKYSIKGLVSWTLLFISLFLILLNVDWRYILIITLPYYIAVSARREKNAINRLLLILITYLPFYMLIRALLQVNPSRNLDNVFNYFRDLIIILLLFLVIRENRYYVGLRKNDNELLVFIIVWAVGITIAVLNGTFWLGLSGLHLSIIPMFLYYVIAYCPCEININAIIWNYIIIALMVAVLGIFSYFFRPDGFVQLFNIGREDAAVWATGKNYVRFVSIFFTPNVCGNYMAIAYSISLVLFLFRGKPGYLIGSLIFGVCVILSMSRGSWAFLAAATLISLFFYRPKLGIKTLIICIILMMVGLVILLNTNIISENIIDVICFRISSLFNLSNDSSFGRFRSVGLALENLLIHPFGYGLGAGSTAAVKYDVIQDFGVLDGFYGKTLMEYGFLGLFYIVIFIVWILKKHIYSYRKTKSEISAIAIIVSVGFLVQSIGSNTFDLVCTSPMLWIVLGAAEKIRNESFQKKFL